jgi:hypothetical protein
LLPINIIAKHEGQAIVASRERQNWHSGASVEVAAPQFGQWSVPACTLRILAGASCKRRDVDYGMTLFYPHDAANSKQQTAKH